MKTRALAMLVAINFCWFAAASASEASAEKQLENVRGSVLYQRPGGTAETLAAHASIELPDQDYAITGRASLARVELPNRSTVLVGSDSKVQLLLFNEVAGTNARFVVVDGRIRFTVRHPAGVRADYTFETPAATIGVRGTQGDVDVSNDGSLRVNVYEVCNPNEPVEVRIKGGTVYELLAGQSLFTHLVNGSVQTKVQQLTQPLVDEFAGDFGSPASWNPQTQAISMGRTQPRTHRDVAAALDSITEGTSSQSSSAAGALYGRQQTPQPLSSPPPSPSSASCGQ
jgi:hypothetical protein